MAKKKRPYVPQWDPIDSWAVHQAEQQQQQQQRQQPAPKQEETGFWDQARKGALGRWEQVKALPDQLGFDLDVRNVSRATSDLGTFQQIDKGTHKSSLFDSLMPGGGESVAKRWMSGQTDEAFRQSRVAAQYSAATPQQRTDLIKSRRGALETARTSAMENVAQIGEAQKRAAPYAPAVEDFTDIRSLGDFNKWLGYSIGSGAVSSAPALGIGLLTRSPAATVGVATGMEYGSGIQDRLNFIQNKVANLPAADQANAIIQYVDATKDETLRAALASGTLELFGPEAGAIKRALIKKAATEAGQEVAKTGFKEGLKAAGKEGLEEFATGGAQQAANLNLQFALDERQGSLLDRDSLKEIFNAAMAEGAGGFAIGGGMNIIQSRGVKGKGSDTNVDDQSLIKGKEDTDLGSDVAGGTEADDTITSGTKAAEPVREPQILPTEVVKGLFNEGNVIASLSNTGIAPKYLPTLAKRLTSAFQNNNEKELDNILKAQERRVDPAHSSVKSDEDLARNEAVYGAVSQLIGNFREFHSQALQEEELLTGPSEVTKYVGEKLKQEVARAKEAQLRTQQAYEILNAQRQEAELQEQQRIASEAAAREQEIAAAAREQEIAAAAKRVENIHRQGILQTVVNDPETRDPVKRFTSLLKRNNFDATVSPEEAKALEAAAAKLEQRTAGEAAKAGLSVEEYKQNLPAKSLREAENLGMTPEQYMTAKGAADEMGISVPAFVQMQQEQQLARQAVQAQPPAKPPVPFFELQAEREMGPADIAAMEKAQAKRERKAQRDAAKMAEQAVEDREQLSFLTEAAPAPEVVEGKKVVTPAKTGIKQKFDVGKKRAEAFDIAERERRAKAMEEDRAKAAKAKKSKRPALPKDKVAETKTEQKAKRPALPKDKVVEQKAESKPVIKEKKSAAQKRKKPESGVSQRVRTSEERKAPEAGRGNRPEQGRTVKEKVKEEVAKPEVTYEDVLKEAETYLAEDGETGLLKPTEYQQLSILAEQGGMSPQELRDRLDAIVTARSERAMSDATSKVQAGGSVKKAQENRRKLDKVAQNLRAQLRALGLEQAAVGLSDKKTVGARGKYDPNTKLMMVAYDLSERGRSATLNHEVIHYLVDIGALTKDDWSKLEAAAAKNKRLQRWYTANYKSLYEGQEYVDMRAEEIAAEMFSEWMESRQPAPSGLGGIFTKIRNFFRAITNAYKREGFDTAESVFEAIASGQRSDAGVDLFKSKSSKTIKYSVSEKDVEGAEPLVGAKKSPVRQRKIDTFLEGLPSAISEPVRLLVDNTSGLPTRVAVKYLMLGNTLMSAARSAGIKSIDKFDRLKRDQKAIARRVENEFESWGRSYHELPNKYLGTGKGTINDMIQRMTDEGKWAFEPDYFRGDHADTKVEVDTELGLEFESMPKNVQDFIKKGFQLSHDMLLDMRQSVVDWASSEYDGLIKQAENDPVKKEKLKQEKAQSLRKYKSMMDINPTTPYAPMQRDGDWVVVAVTDDYRTAEELGDEELLKELEATDKFVDFAYTRGEAARLVRSIGGTYKAENIQMFPRDHAAEQYSSGKDLMALFAKLRNSIADSSDLTAPQRKQLDNAVINMQLMALASSSARKGEIKRRKIRSGDLDMVRNIVSRGRSGAQFIASVYKSGEITDALKEMANEVRQRGGDRELKQTIYNTVLARHLDDITPHAQENVLDTVTAATSIYMLATNPGFHIQQMAQNPMVVAPILEDKFGAKRTLKALWKGYVAAFKVLSNLNANEILDLKKLDPKYRALATYMSEFGTLDVGVEKEMGRQRTSETGMWSSINNVLRTGTRINEALNRLAASIASYELELEDAKNGKGVVLHDPDAYKAYEDEYLNARHDFEPLTKEGFSAAYNTAKLIDDTHFDYSSTNKPIWMRRGFVGKVAGQFKTFQFGIGALWAKAFHKAINGSGLSLKERIVASRQLALLIGHTALFAGIRGLPMYAVAKGAYYGIMALFGGDDDDPFAKDLDVKVQEWVGDSYLANLLTKGIPSLAGADMSGSIGQGTITSLAPYADTPVDRDTWVKYSAALLGPSASLVGNFLEGANYLTKGDTLKAAQRMLPKGLANIAKAEELRQSGATTKKGKVIQEDISSNELFWTILGVSSVEATARMERQSVKYDMERYYKDKSSELISQMAEASKSGDQKAAANAVSEWRDLQESRRKQGYDTRPVGYLYKAAYKRLREQSGAVRQKDAGVDERLDDLYGAPYEEDTEE